MAHDLEGPATGSRQYLSSSEIAAWATGGPEPAIGGALRHTLQRHGLWNPLQLASRYGQVACVALEITQRCNLDCELCYLSEHSEAVRDLPLPEIFRRIDMIKRHYGPGTNVQVTGGDPTLRQRVELIAIVRRLAEQGLRPALFTNGIRARRDLLTELAHVGLKDVAFHVDTTQRRKAFDRKAILGAMRELPPHPEVPDSLRRLQEAGLRLCALTNSTRVVAEAQLEHAGLTAHFERILSAEAVRRLKPHADVYRMAARECGVEPGALRLVAAHSWDVAGALRAGCAAAFVARPGMTLDPLFERPDIVGSDLAAVAERILAIEAPQSGR